MSDLGIIIWGFLAFILAVGPLMVAAYLDNKDRQRE
jgi:hypothetical protein